MPAPRGLGTRDDRPPAPPQAPRRARGGGGAAALGGRSTAVGATIPRPAPGTPATQAHVGGSPPPWGGLAASSAPTPRTAVGGGPPVDTTQRGQTPAEGPTGPAATPGRYREAAAPSGGAGGGTADDWGSDEMWQDVGLDPDFGRQWAQQFAAEHGGLPPWEAGTMSGIDNLQEHVAALQWGTEFARETGRQPTQWDYAREWWTNRFGEGSNWRIPGASPGGGMGYAPPRYMMTPAEFEKWQQDMRFGGRGGSSSQRQAEWEADQRPPQRGFIY